jgi:hypothetical protein
MKRIMYAGGSFLTSDAVAASLLDLAAALARRNTADTLKVPIVTADGAASTATLVIGPASQVLAEDVASEGDDPDFSIQTAAFDKRRRSLIGEEPNAEQKEANASDSQPQGELWFDEPTDAPYGN